MKESKELQRMDDLLIEIDKRLSKLAGTISKDNLIDDDISSGHLKEPVLSYVNELFSISNYIDDNRVTPTEINSKSKTPTNTEKYKKSLPIFKFIGAFQLILIIAIFITPLFWIWGDFTFAWKVGLSEFLCLLIINKIDRYLRKLKGIK